MKYSFIFVFLLICPWAFGQRQLTHSVQFELDHSDIASEQQELLKTWLHSIADTLLRIEVVGHADYLGSEEYNLVLSQNRADAVMAFIEKMEGLAFRSSLVSSVGEKFSKAEPQHDGRPNDRKVEIIVSVRQKPEQASTLPLTQKKVAEKPVQYTESDLLVKADVGQTVVLQNLNFFPGRHYLIPSAMPELERLIGIMNENPTMAIEIQGHICCKLDSIDGLDVNTRTYSLSANRAEYIAQQLVLAGVDENRIEHRGFAGSRPLIEPELTARDRQRNRRVEIKILKK